MMVAEVYKYKFYKYYEDGMSVSDIQLSDEVFVYELEDTPTNWPPPKPKSMLYFHEDPTDPDKLLVPVISKRAPRGRARFSGDTFGVPFFIVLNKDEQYDLSAIQERIIQRLQLLTTRDLYAAPLEAEDELELAGPEELLVNALSPEPVKEASDEEKDGFIDIKMKDAASTTASSEDADADGGTTTASSPPATARARAPGEIADQMFSIKVSKCKKEDRLLPGWSLLEPDFDISSRLPTSRNRTPSPSPQLQAQLQLQLPQQQQPSQQASALFGNLASGGNSGRRSPVSTVSDDDDDNLYKSAVATPEENEDMMRGSSDEENDTAHSADMAAFGPPTIDNGYYTADNFSANVFSPERSPATSSTDNGALIRLNESIILEFHDEGYDITFGGNDSRDFRGALATWPLLDDPELARRRQKRQEKERMGIHLEDCLDEFAKEEVLSAEDPWYCPRCKEHRRASKKFELWKCPDVLVIHLKRFSSSRSFRDKIDALIHCPIENLDLKDRVGVTDGKDQIYDLIAVDNHYGGLGGGHYTACIKNWCDQKWYYCDGWSSLLLFLSPTVLMVILLLDACVRGANPAAVVTSAAYLLFYRRRSSKPLGGPGFERIVAAVENAGSDEEEEAPSREATPSPLGPAFGPLPPTPNDSFGGFGPVGNGTLWGNSLPKGSDDSAIQSLTEGVRLDEGLGDEQEMADAVFVPVPAAPTVEPEEKVEEVRLGEGEG